LSSGEEEQDEDDEDEKKEYDEEEMALFIKKFNKYISKRRPFKGDKKEKTIVARECTTIVARMDISLPNAQTKKIYDQVERA
jgi:hypothetical protein